MGLEQCLATQQHIRMACGASNKGLSLMFTVEESDEVFLCDLGDSTGEEGKTTWESL